MDFPSPSEIEKAYEKFGISQVDVQNLLRSERYRQLASAIDYIGDGTYTADAVVVHLSRHPDAPWSHVWSTKPLRIRELQDASRQFIGGRGFKALSFYADLRSWISKDILDLSPADIIEMKRKPGVGRVTMVRVLEMMAVVEATERFSKHPTPQTPTPVSATEADGKLGALFAREGLSLTSIRYAIRASPEVRAAILAEITKCDPNSIKALLKAAGPETLGDEPATTLSGSQGRFPLMIGQPVTDQGIPFGEWKSGDKAIGLHLIPDFLRDASGEIVALNADQALDAITAFNEGVKYGNGYERANARAIAKSEFKDGTLILARRQDLLKIARERETNLDLKLMNDIITSCKPITDDLFGNKCRCVSSTKHPRPSTVYHVHLKEGVGSQGFTDGAVGRVVVLCGVTLG